MLVYGDHRERVDPAERLEALSRRLPAIAAMPPGIERHAKLVGALIEAGQLLQGVADEGPAPVELQNLVYALGKAVVRSWDSRFGEIGDVAAVRDLVLPPSVEVRLPEGFAFYAVYPEAYAEAARRLRLGGPARVLGIRSIGTSLAAVVAAALDAPSPLTVRPFGDPFARKVELPDQAIEAGAHYVIVDEGPGLSGSSFGAVADALEDRGVAPERIAFLPSHAGPPGPQASDRHRQRWVRAQRVSAEADLGWLAERFGPLDDITGSGPWERRKFLGTCDGARVLLKFAGLGAIGERKLAMARALHSEGLTPEPTCLVHGFLAERWCGDAAPLGAREKPVREIGRYIGARARLFPADRTSGASIATLVEMAKRNVSLALGAGLARVLDAWDAAELEQRVVRVRTDNKLDRHEWLRCASGALIKTDALDHHQAHDLIGCQDVAWDVAGAIVEFDLDQVEAADLIASVEHWSGREIDAALLGFMRIAYLAFRMGQARLGATMTSDARERERLERSGNRYATEVQHLLDRSRPATRLECSVGWSPERTGSGTTQRAIG